MLAVTILQLDMLPTPYLLIVLGILGLTALFMGLLLYQPRYGRFEQRHSYTRVVLGFILSVIVILASLIGAGAIHKVNGTISAVTKSETVSSVVDIYVLADNPAQNIDDARDYRFAATDSYDWENTQIAIEEVEEYLGTSIDIATYPSVFEMVDALYNEEADALFLDNAYIDILIDTDEYADFAELTRIIHENSVKKTDPVENANPGNFFSDLFAPHEKEEEVFKDTTKPFLIYLSGSDTRSKILSKSRNDVNIIAAVNPQTKQVLLVNTPRDYYVGNPAGGGRKDKLTHCGIYGVDCSIEALEALYNEEIAYYAQINFTGFETLIDAIGGITVNSNVSFTTTIDSYRIKAGDNKLNGHQALCFARERYALAGGDNDRGKNQMKVITAVIKKLMSARTVIANYGDIMSSLEGMFVTNMTQDDMSKLVKMQLSDMASWDVLSYAVTGTGSSKTTYSMPSTNAYVMIPNQDTVDRAAALFDRIMSGEKITSDDLS